MIKKFISTALIILVLINSIGCYSRVYLFQEDMEELSKGDKIMVITQDRKAHNITVVRIEGTEIHGIEYTEGQESQVVIHSEEISLIEMDKLEVGKTILLGIACTFVIATGAVIIIFVATYEK